MASLPFPLNFLNCPYHGALNQSYSYMPQPCNHQQPPTIIHHRHQHHHHNQPLNQLSMPRPLIIKKEKCEGASGKNVVSPVGKDGFQVCVDVQQFKPNELTVKTVDRNIIIEGKHEEREDKHGLISMNFVRRYHLPDGYDPNQIVSTLSSDGVLTVNVPPPPKPETGNERIVQIQQAGPAHLSVSITKEEKKGEDEKEK